jgi:type IV secretory pathway protease TraF
MAGCAGLGLAAHAMPPLALVNASPSLPEGLYLRSLDQSLRPGAVIALEPPPPARRYLAGLGMPARVPLLKRIAATSGDEVCRTGRKLQWPGHAVWALTRDRRGAQLPTWSGCRRLARDQLLVLGETPTSFDSRYFGPVRRTRLRGVYVEAFKW